MTFVMSLFPSSFSYLVVSLFRPSVICFARSSICVSSFVHYLFIALFIYGFPPFVIYFCMYVFRSFVHPFIRLLFL